MKIQNRIFPIFLLLFISTTILWAQKSKKREVTVAYIEQYKDLAIYHMEKSKIPASITLAQGILESNSGLSVLARKANNHFGIKKHEWKGKTIRVNDDKPNEEFRVYKNAEESFNDHSAFLLKHQRYRNLFKLDIRSYKDWAVGLQKSGYATSPAYANSLITMVENYELYHYDLDEKTMSSQSGKKQTAQAVRIRKDRDVFKTYGLIYVIAEKDDNFDNIAYDMGFKVKDLLKYNEVPKDFPLAEGDVVYLEKKKKKADKPNYEHLVHAGESMHSISQFYGIQLSRLYKMNEKDFDYVPEDGTVLKLR